MTRAKELILIAVTIIVATFLIVRQPTTTAKVVESSVPAISIINLILPGMLIAMTIVYLIISNKEK